MNYWDDVGFAYQRPPGLINAPIRRDTRRKQLEEEQARRTYQGLLERDLIGIQQFSPFFGLNSRDPDAIPIAPMDVVPAGAGAKALGLLSTIPVGMIGALGYHGGRKWAPEVGRPLGRPRLENVGQGEGAQVYGHGFYVAENPEVGRGYFRALDRNRDVYHNELNVGGMDVVKGGVPVDYSPPRRPKGTSEVVHNADQARAVLTEDLLIHEWKINEAFLQGGESGAQKAILDIVDERLRAAADEWPEIVPHLQRVRSKVLRDGIKIDPEVSTANFYKMDVPDDDVAKMLDWDKPLIDPSQPAGVRALYSQIYDEPVERMGSMTGGSFYDDFSLISTIWGLRPAPAQPGAHLGSFGCQI